MRTRTYNGPVIDIQHDQNRNIYCGTLTSQTGQFIVEGPDQPTVRHALERKYAEECEALERKIEKDETEEKLKKKGHSLSLSMGDSSGDKSRKKGKYGLLDATTDLTKVFSGGIFALMDKLLGLVPSPKRFAVAFGGAMLYARSRRALRKKLILMRNRRIQRIMEHERQHREEMEKTKDLSKKRAKEAAKRLQHRKEQARELASRSWEHRVKPHGQEKDWESRVKTIQTRIKDKKEQARDLWAGK